MCTNINSNFHTMQTNPTVESSFVNSENCAIQTVTDSNNCSDCSKNHKKINFRQRIRSLRKECEDGPLLASTEDLPDTLDDSDFILASRHKKGKKTAQKKKTEANDCSLNSDQKILQLDPVGISKKSSIEHFSPENLLEFANNYFPNMKKLEFYQLLQSVKEQNNKSLNGLSNDEIFCRIELLKYKLENPEGRNKDLEPLKPSPVWCNIPRNTVKRVLDFEECCICFQPWTENKVSLEECGHCFHPECIRLWMKQKNTCPFCSGFSLLLDDFPKLT